MEVKDWSRGVGGGTYYLHFVTKAYKWKGLGPETTKHTFIPCYVTGGAGKPPSSSFSVRLGRDTIPKYSEGNVDYSSFVIYTTSRGRSKIPTYRAAGFVEPRHVPAVARKCAEAGHLVEIIHD